MPRAAKRARDDDDDDEGCCCSSALVPLLPPFPLPLPPSVPILFFSILTAAALRVAHIGELGLELGLVLDVPDVDLVFFKVKSRSR